MKLSCLQENLNKGLGIVGRAVATRTTLPITQNVLLATDESRLKLSATNLEMAISCWIGAKVETEGAITVPARLISEFTGSLPSDRIDIELSKNTLQVQCGRYEARINGLDAADFPPVPQVGDGIATKIEAEAFREGINRTFFAAAADESRPVLTGVQLNFEADKLTMAAADGFRLSVHDVPLLSPVDTKTAIIVRARTLNEVGRFIADDEEPVEITVNEQKSQVLFRVKNIEVVSQVIQGTFPNYEQLIPKSYETRAVIDREEFLRANKMASIFARDGSGIVRLAITPGPELSPGKMAVSARAEEIGENVGEIDALIDGQESKIAFNAKYLSEVLTVLNQSQVALEITNASSPGVIRPIGADNYIHVVMPMFVQW
jgi:DNA polymerase-3 subunit beta